MQEKREILFICTYNSVRSQMAESIINSRYSERFHADSAGLIPGGVDQCAISALKKRGIDTTGLRSKSLGELADKKYDQIIFLCENALLNTAYLPVQGRVECRFVSVPSAKRSDGLSGYEILAEILENMFESDPLFH